MNELELIRPEVAAGDYGPFGNFRRFMPHRLELKTETSFASGGCK